MTDVTLEKIDQVLERVPSASYAQAKEALIISNGNIVDAIIYLEQSKKTAKVKTKAKAKMENALGKDAEELKCQLKEMLKRSNVIRIIVEKDNKTIMNIPLTVGVVGLALGPLVTLVGLSAAVIGKFNIKVENEEDKTVVDLGELNEEKLNMLKNMLTNTAKEVTDVVKENKKDEKDITDELIKEETENELRD
ncbi:DUF4342 domain-containing protein [Paraclostridium sordellii]|uniref:Ubiquitin-associated domain-containing protein n=1 Tax=Paraclostridium sordellii TaxID=1505 RepID=A0A0C7HVS4_PARSO|nr:DUF4342 domain-containing protein [Paeniclostridium sordellii]CEN79541.1 ubiquitin-associated domain-containing protein [[Clostridium] sordellii] [Paeniclostridium sordellii]CEO05679.1 ubiquitin-associated domain-containing protein [[Clostridium] sordellii] [Paeniclostridium sordellii]CEP86167.1 ubiquitin-associated domain-containing protein [[Clostridium] sordellii] [Paeniclostridium sordellii]CEP96419.1 ubiquitin-associated domain-containing protein [[Clostridium] sordellii] [Paeniclostrid